MGSHIICIIAGNYEEAKTWARSQFLARNEWFYPEDEDSLKQKYNFHVLIIGTAGLNVPSSYFERILALAQTRGRIGRS